ncbi:MAG TPA: outer membrane lipoprotein chaperone LolA [Steroidobacteraceae bacterium]|nr:outer membrane lipoprotein chaperone LolA [Steroidobacteraceae bacterium]
MRIRVVILCGLSLLGLTAAAEPGHTVLDTWLTGLKSLRVQFTQTIKDAQGHTTDQTSGELLVLRPGRFRWDSHDDAAAPAGSAPTNDSGQVLIADGRNVWFYDRDLQQVTVKPVDAALSATPIMLLSGGADVRKAFDISDAGNKDGLAWLRVKPRAAEADFRQAVLGFAEGELKEMILEDKLGQLATLTFSRSQRNAPVSEAEVSFTPPKGVDVIGKPKP